MSHPDRIFFEALKETVAESYRKKAPDAPIAMSDWRGKDIEGFQSDLMEVANGRISTKWFYTHMKGAHENLPRIDVLNLLCQYAGFENWEAFKSQKQADGLKPTKQPEAEKPAAKRGGIRDIIILPIIAIIGLLAWYWIGTGEEEELPSMLNCRFCFRDADFDAPITESNIEITVLQAGESPKSIVGNKGGCVEIGTNDSILTFVVNARYYKQDTVVRKLLGAPGEETILLRRDDYANMINVFSKSDVKDWERRREQLNKMLADDAVIYQLSPDRKGGMELYNKQEFIDKLTFPTSSLKNIEVLETKYQYGRISEMRFVQSKNETNE